MKFQPTYLAGACLGLFLLLFSCKPKEAGAWQKFMACADNNCVDEVVAVKDAFLQDPKPIFEEFIKTDERGEDSYIGWLYMLRDSVLVNSNFASIEDRFAMQQAVLDKARTFENDPKYGDFAKSMIRELEQLAIASELEDEHDAAQAGYTGTYTYELPNDNGSGEIKILDNGDNTLRFSLNIVGRAPAYNQGMMDGTAQLVDNTATISTTEYGGKCTITLTFGEDGGLVAKTLAGDDVQCGFGHNITADGTYKMVDDLDPFRAEGGDEVPAALEGDWVSTTDPKSELTIIDGKYIEYYESEVVSNTPFRYNKACPKDCNPVANTPCLQLIGQDVVCYTIVKSNGKTLELSMIGGTGNTLVYKLKG